MTLYEITGRPTPAELAQVRQKLWDHTETPSQPAPARASVTACWPPAGLPLDDAVVAVQVGFPVAANRPAF